MSEIFLHPVVKLALVLSAGRPSTPKANKKKAGKLLYYLETKYELVQEVCENQETWKEVRTAVLGFGCVASKDAALWVPNVRTKHRGLLNGAVLNF